MLKTCIYCKKIHDDFFVCKEKQILINKRAMQDRHSKEYSRIIKTAYWKHTSENIRDKANGLCEYCKSKGIISKADSVHHIIKILNDNTKAFNSYNLIALCNNCHRKAENNEIDIKTLQEIVREREMKNNLF